MATYGKDFSDIKGGEKFEAVLTEMARRFGTGKAVRVGFLEGAKYDDGTSVAMVAAIQNYGAPSRGIPPRPFFSNMIAEKSPEWPDAIAGLLKTNDYDAVLTLTQVGEAIAGQLKDSINNGSYAPLKQSTIDRKGFDKPLIDTGHMINSIDYEVT